jgi:hypothetical protein
MKTSSALKTIIDPSSGRPAESKVAQISRTASSKQEAQEKRIPYFPSSEKKSKVYERIFTKSPRQKIGLNVRICLTYRNITYISN